MANYIGLEKAMQRVSIGLKRSLGEHSNTIFTITQFSGNVALDGNGNFTLDTPTIIKVKAKLHQKKDPYPEQRAGTDVIRTYMEGYLVKPLQLSGTFHNNLECQIKQDNVLVTGKFTFIDQMPSTLKENFKLSVGIGQKICGYFVRNHESI